MSIIIPDFCSHRRSWMYFAESVRHTNSKTFYSVPCSTWQDFVTQNCPENTTTTQTFMGIDTNPNLTGDFFLQTNAQEPYSRGIYGIFYDETFSEVWKLCFEFHQILFSSVLSWQVSPTVYFWSGSMLFMCWKKLKDKKYIKKTRINVDKIIYYSEI